jgi:hypothetical protein
MQTHTQPVDTTTTFSDITFDTHGYTSLEKVVSHFVYMSYTTAMWLYKARAFLDKHGLALDCATVSKSELENEKARGRYPLILCREKSKTGVVNKQAVIRLAQAAHAFGYTSEAASGMLVHLGMNPDAAYAEAGLPAQRQRLHQTRDLPLPESGGGDEDNSLMLLDLDLDTVPENLETQVWLKHDVIMCSAFARFCGVPTKRINSQIRNSAELGNLKEGQDFFSLERGKALAFCEMNDLSIPGPAEVRNGIFLLTQIGVNNLAKYLKNEKAKMHSDAVSLSAAVVQDIARKGSGSEWIKDPARITSILTSLSEAHGRVLEANKVLTETNALLVKEASAREGRALDLCEKMAEVKETVLSTADINELMDQKLIAKKYMGPNGFPDDLVCKAELSTSFFPGVSKAVICSFLDSVGHPKKMWMRIEPSVDSESNLQEPESYERKGIEARQTAFFQEVRYRKSTPCLIKFRIRSWNFQISKGIEQELPADATQAERHDARQEAKKAREKKNAFMHLLFQHQPGISGLPRHPDPA